MSQFSDGSMLQMSQSYSSSQPADPFMQQTMADSNFINNVPAPLPIDNASSNSHSHSNSMQNTCTIAPSFIQDDSALMCTQIQVMPDQADISRLTFSNTNTFPDVQDILNQFL